MNIWDDLYKQLINSELKQDNVSASGHETHLTVESKVTDLQNRVGLAAVSSVPPIDKTAMLKSASAKGFPLFVKATADAHPNPSVEESLMMDVKAYIMELLDIRRASLGLPAIYHELKNKFPDQADFLRQNKVQILEFAQKYQQKFIQPKPRPVPVYMAGKPDVNSDNKTFENITESLKG